jgi:hypothetical protein
MITSLDNSKRYRAKVRNLFGDCVNVVSSCDTPASSYRLQHWVDEDGNSYGQITLPSPFYDISEIREISEDEADSFLEEGGAV